MANGSRRSRKFVLGVEWMPTKELRQIFDGFSVDGSLLCPKLAECIGFGGCRKKPRWLRRAGRQGRNEP